MHTTAKHWRAALRVLIVAITAALALAPAVGQADVIDGFTIASTTVFPLRGLPCSFNASNATSESAGLQCDIFALPAAIPMGVGVVVLREPAGEVDSVITDVNLLNAIHLPGATNVSDVLFLQTNIPILNVLFLSDGASQAAIDFLTNEINSAAVPAIRIMSVTENGTLQDVSAFFGNPKGTVRVGSDVPEPSAFLLLATGLVALLGYIWRQRKNVA
jgi:hypothetical protein